MSYYNQNQSNCIKQSRKHTKGNYSFPYLTLYKYKQNLCCFPNLHKSNKSASPVKLHRAFLFACS